MPEDSNSYLNTFGFSQPFGKTYVLSIEIWLISKDILTNDTLGEKWFMDQPLAYDLLRNNPRKEIHNAILLHNKSLLNANMENGHKIGDSLGTLDLGFFSI